MAALNRQSRSPQRLAFIAVALLMLLLGHDVAMAASAHSTPLPHAAHTLVVQQCGPTDGLIQQVVDLPAPHGPAVVRSLPVPGIDTWTPALMLQSPLVLDYGGSLRIWLQVFLN